MKISPQVDLITIRNYGKKFASFHIYSVSEETDQVGFFVGVTFRTYSVRKLFDFILFIDYNKYRKRGIKQ